MRGRAAQGPSPAPPSGLLSWPCSTARLGAEQRRKLQQEPKLQPGEKGLLRMWRVSESSVMGEVSGQLQDRRSAQHRVRMLIRLGSLAAQHPAGCSQRTQHRAWTRFPPEDGAASEAMHTQLCTSSTNLGVFPLSRLSLGLGKWRWSPPAHTASSPPGKGCGEA